MLAVHTALLSLTCPTCASDVEATECAQMLRTLRFWSMFANLLSCHFWKGGFIELPYGLNKEFLLWFFIKICFRNLKDFYC